MDEHAIEFLLRAKRATYAGHGPEVSPSRPASHDLQYVEGSYRYIDTYLGSSRFAGQEAVWHKALPIWAMNYVGRVLSEGFSGEFLKEALRAAPREAPYRGPQAYASGPYLYKCTVEGGIDWFYGYEEMFYHETLVYECAFHGGAVV